MAKQNNSYPLCDFKECPLHNECANYFDTIDKATTDHWAVMPYRKGKCDWFVPYDIDDKIKDFFKNKTSN